MMSKTPSEDINQNKTKKENIFVKNIGFFICLFIFTFFFIYFIVLKILESNPETAAWHSMNISQNYLRIVGTITSFLPFSIMEISILCLVLASITLIVFIIINFIKKKPKKALFKIALLSTIAIGVISNYEFSVGVSYHKNNIKFNYDSVYEKSYDYEDTVSFMIDDFNETVTKLNFAQDGQVQNPYSLNEINEIFVDLYSKYDSNNQLYSFTPKVKHLLSSFVFREFQITGVYFGLTGESHITRGIPNSELPYTIAHELAHAKGDMDEYDCNAIAFDICLNSENPYLKYSAYFYQWSSIMNLLNFTGKNEEEISSLRATFIKKFDQRFVKDYTYSAEWWDKHKSLKTLSESLNNWYLQTFGKKNGINNYVVDDDAKKEQEENPTKIVYTKIQKIFLNRYNKKDS